MILRHQPRTYRNKNESPHANQSITARGHAAKAASCCIAKPLVTPAVFAAGAFGAASRTREYDTVNIEMPKSLTGTVAILLACALPAASQLVQLRHWSGQGVAPVYEGFDTNPDGSFNMWFGYMNRNYEEALDIPVGPSNKFEPGADRAQPTHFLIRRHKDVFKVTVPKDFGDKSLVWTLTAHGQTQQVTASLKPVWMIDHQRTTRGGNIDTIDSNTPPVVKVQMPEQTIAFDTPAILRIAATDDGLPVRRGEPIGMTIAWGKYRGPGKVTFEPTETAVVNGTAEARATFSEPGEYILQAVVDDGSGELAGNFGYHCCWTNAQVKIIVRGTK
jgi:hypothetical protein